MVDNVDGRQRSAELSAAIGGTPIPPPISITRFPYLRTRSGIISRGVQITIPRFQIKAVKAILQKINMQTPHGRHPKSSSAVMTDLTKRMATRRPQKPAGRAAVLRNREINQYACLQDELILNHWQRFCNALDLPQID